MTTRPTDTETLDALRRLVAALDRYSANPRSATLSLALGEAARQARLVLARTDQPTEATP